MPYTVRQLVAGIGTPVTADPEEPIETALDRMLQHRFSQLPLTIDDKHYFITQESILAALNMFGVPPKDSGLKVKDALVRPGKTFFEEDPLFDLLNEMRDNNAAIVLEEDGKSIKHVVTTFDTTQFFRQWSEDMLHARDIELNLKKIIRASFKTQGGEIDEVALSEAIADVTPSNKTLRRKFETALGIYSENCTASKEFDVEAAEKAFKVLYNQTEQVKSFEKLTLDPYLQLFFSDTCWGRCFEAFGVKEAINTMLNGVRDTRNKIAHFEEDQITAREREQLRSCAEWLGDREKKAITLLESSAPANLSTLPIEPVETGVDALSSTEAISS